MRCGRPSGAAAERQNLPTIDFVAFLDLELRKMEIERYKALAMVYRHAIAFKVKGARQDNRTGVGRVNRGSGSHLKIQTRVRVPLYPVVKAG